MSFSFCLTVLTTFVTFKTDGNIIPKKILTLGFFVAVLNDKKREAVQMKLYYFFFLQFSEAKQLS